MPHGNYEVLRKKMVICTPFGEYVNGDQEGDMTPAKLRALAENYQKHPRQVFVYALGDHEFDPDKRLPDGWVEGLEYTNSYPGYPQGALVADVKLHGEGARYVVQDLVRLASIGCVEGFNPDGSPQGEVLQHVLLTNNAFDTTVNIAAARKGGEPVRSFFTALKRKFTMAFHDRVAALMTEKEMSAEDVAGAMEGEGARDASTVSQIARGEIEIPPVEVVSSLAGALGVAVDELESELSRGGSLDDHPDDKDDKKGLKAARTLLETKTRENKRLQAKNANLLADLKRREENPSLTAALAKLKSADRQIRAGTIRRLVAEGVSDGKFNIAQVGEPREGWNNRSDELVLEWFTSSMFKGSVDRLEFALESFDRKQVNQRFRTGSPGDSSEPVLTEGDRTELRKQGIDPAAVIAGMKARNLTEFKELTAKK